MAMTAATPSEQEPDPSSAWIRANVTASAAVALCSLATAILEKVAKAPEGASITLSIGVVVASAVIMAAGGAVFAQQTGKVLASRLPVFPMRIWIGFHAVFGLLGTALATAMSLAPDAESGEAITPASLALLAAIMLGVASVGIAALLQALILRKVVSNVGAWIKLSVLAGVPFGLTTLPGLQTSEPLDIAGLILLSLTEFFVYIVIAIVLLPAVRGFKPR